MPCRDYEVSSGHTISGLHHLLDTRTAQLCAVLNYIDNEYEGWLEDVLRTIDNNHTDLDIQEWWEHHKQQDLRERALSKLTPAEIRALGLDE